MNWKSIVWIDDIVAQLWHRRLYWNKEKIRHGRNTDFKHASMIFITRRGVAACINCSDWKARKKNKACLNLQCAILRMSSFTFFWQKFLNVRHSRD